MKSTVNSRFRAVVRCWPQQEAIADSYRSLTYIQLLRLADTIRSRMPQPRPRFVGIVMDHGIEQIASMLAVMLAGGAYVPAEPSLPHRRIMDMMRQADVDYVIASPAYAGRFGDIPELIIPRGIEQDLTVTVAEADVKPDDPAYVLFTSGTTGRPKGIVVTNANVCHYARAFYNEFRPRPGFRMLQHSVCSFDIFVEEVMATLLNGATLVIPSEYVKADILRLLRFIDKYKVTALSGFPYLLLELNKQPSIPESLKLLISGGDVLRASYITNLLPKATVYNTYGPSETTVCATYFRCNGSRPLPDGSYPIGTPVRGAEVIIMEPVMPEAVPAGSPGEICIKGGGVSKGYLHECPESCHFTVDPADGRPIYRSGDMGYVTSSGQIAFIGRADRQVMILGRRVECDEVENTIVSDAEVETAVVEPQTDADGLAYLTAYVVPRRGSKFSIDRLRRRISRFLASFMVPEFIVSMKSIPLTPNGKPDRKALPRVRRKDSRL